MFKILLWFISILFAALVGSIAGGHHIPLVLIGVVSVLWGFFVSSVLLR